MSVRVPADERQGNLPLCGGGYGLEVGPPRLDKVVQDLCPVIAGIPSDFAGRIHLDGHHLTDTPALDEDDQRPDATTLATTVLPPLDVCSHERIMAGHV